MPGTPYTPAILLTLKSLASDVCGDYLESIYLDTLTDADCKGAIEANSMASMYSCSKPYSASHADTHTDCSDFAKR